MQDIKQPLKQVRIYNSLRLNINQVELIVSSALTVICFFYHRLTFFKADSGYNELRFCNLLLDNPMGNHNICQSFKASNIHTDN